MRLEIIKLSWSKILYRKRDNLWHYYTRYRRINPDGSHRTTRPTLSRVDNAKVLKIIKECKQANYSYKSVSVFTDSGKVEVELASLSNFVKKDKTFSIVKHVHHSEINIKFVPDDTKTTLPFRLRLVRWFSNISEKIKEMV